MILHSNIIGKGTPFVILHGFLGAGDNWKTLSKDFADLGFEVHLVDQRNHGRSFHSDEFNYDVMSDDLKAYFEQHSIPNAVVLGHSMGGKTAMLFSSKYPDLVRELIVADISPRYYPSHHQAILNGLNQLDFNVIKSRKEADVALSKYVSDFGTRQFLLKNLYWIEKGKLALRLNLETLTAAAEDIGEALPTLSKFTKKALFLKGDRSEYIGVQEEPIIKQHFPNASIKTIPNAGHWLHAENPDAFLAEVQTFLNL